MRVLATLPAYGPSGELLFWYPLGELGNNGFTEDKAGVTARENAIATPIYVFPLKVDYTTVDAYFSFNNSRHAAIVGPPPPISKGSPLGVRIIVRVNYTPLAFTKEAAEMMEYMMRKNGPAVDGTPIIRTLGDLEILEKSMMISMESKPLWDDGTAGVFAIAPVISDPTNGAVADDAFLLMSTIDGKSLLWEEIFNLQFNCLKKTTQWCKAE